MRRVAVTAIVGLALLGLSVPLLADRVEISEQVERLQTVAQEQLADRNYKQATETLTKLVKAGTGTPAGVKARLLLGKARLQAGDGAGAIAAWADLVKRYPESDYASKAKFLIAEAHIEGQAIDRGTLAYNEQAQHLRGSAYRARLADLYLELADEAFVGKLVGRKDDPLDPQRYEHDWPRASAMYAQAHAVGVKAERLAEVEFRMAYTAVQLGQHARAEQLYAAALEHYPKHALAPAALLERAKTLGALGRSAEQRQQLQLVLADFPTSEQAPLALIALGASLDPLNTVDHEAASKAIAHWRTFLDRYPEHESAAQVSFDIARTLHNMGSLEKAIAAYGQVGARYPQAPFAAGAAFATGQAQLQRQNYDAARGAWSAFIARYPNDPQFVEAQKQIVASLFREGQDLHSAKRYQDATNAWKRFLATYPAHDLAPQAARMVGEMLLKTKQTSLALEALATCSTKYSHSPEAPRAHLLIADTLEQQGGLGEAISTLEQLIKQWPNSQQARRASRRLATMKEKTLSISAKRAYTTTEPLVLATHTRNIPNLTFKSYPVDLVEYFRKKHHIGSVDKLAVEIVAPTQTWTDDVATYEPYRLFERDVKLPLTGPGAYVVSCEEEEYRAVSLVLRSDISIVCKQGPKQLLVFAIHEPSGKPMPEVDLIIATRSKTIAEGKTGKDGVFVESFEDPPGRLAVFAHSGTHYAFTQSAPSSQAVWDEGYSAKAFIYTDRPVYRPGQQVHYRGILRLVTGGHYVTSANTPIRVSVTDSHNAVIRQLDTKTNAFGSFSASLLLGEESPLGDYTVTCRHSGNDYHGSFSVEAYEKPEALIEVNPGQRTALGGEEVRVAVKASYAFGGPVRDAAVRYQVWRRSYAFDDSRYRSFSWFFKSKDSNQDHDGGDLVATGETTTDEDGEAQIRFPTEDQDDDYLHTVVVEVKQRSGRFARGSANVFVTDRAFYPVVQADKKVYRPKEPIAWSVVTADASHAPVAVKGKVVVSKQRPEVGFDPVEEHPLTTDADGKAALELTLTEPGRYSLAFESSDRRGTSISGSVLVTVAGETKDLAKEAQLVCERAIYKRGELANVVVNTPAVPTYALLTFEGASVLDYQVVQLKGASTTLSLPMRDAYAPNVFIRIAIPANKQLYEAEDEVAVFKYMNVKVTTSKATCKPGDELEVDVRTTDHAGKPVAAEVSLAVVDKTIFAIHPDTTPAIQPFFYDRRRKHAVGTKSSYSWNYKGVTARQMAELLAELERRTAEKVVNQESRRDRARYGKKMEAMERAYKPKPSEQPMDAPSAVAEATVGGAAFGRGSRFKNGPKGSLSFADEDEEYGAGEDAVAMAPPRLRREFADTATWLPHVVTNADGRATVSLTLPDNLTTWRVVSKGTTSDTLVGEAEAEVLATQPMLVRLAAPRFATQGDTFALRALAHNRTDKSVSGTVSLKAELFGKSPTGHGAKRPFTLAAHDVFTSDVVTSSSNAGTLKLSAELLSPAGSDALERPLTVVPWGERWLEAESGAMEDEVRTTITLPSDLVPGTAAIRLAVVPSVSLSIGQALDYLHTFPYGCVEQTVHRFLPAATAAQALARMQSPDAAARKQLTDRLVRGVTHLVHMQNSDGGWGWWKGRSSSTELTALALEGLEIARRSGTHVDTRALGRARTKAKDLLGRTQPLSDGYGMLLKALAMSKRAENTDLSRAVRYGDQLSLGAAATVVLACAEQDRLDIGRPLLARINLELKTKLGPAKSNLAPTSRPRSPVGSWFGGAAEELALCVQAALAASSANPAIADAVDTLNAMRLRHGWRSTKEAAQIVAALAAYAVHQGQSANDYSLTVELDGKNVAQFDSRQSARPGQSAGVLVIDDPALLAPGQHALRLVRKGHGKLHYRIASSATRAKEQIAAAGNLLSISRKATRWIAPRPILDERGRPTTPGYSILDPKARPDWTRQRALDHVDVGDRIVVQLRVHALEALQYILIEDPLPAGVYALESGAQGGFDRFEARDRKAVFFVSKLAKGTYTFSYVARATTPGRYRALPAQIQAMYEPEVWGQSKAGSVFTVAEAGKAPKLAPTPDEIYAQALERIDNKKYREARALLLDLLGMKLRAEVRYTLLAHQVRVCLALDEGKTAIGAFEDLQRLNPTAAGALALEHGMQLGQAYIDNALFEPALTLLRQQVLQQFKLDARVADVYRKLDRPLPAQDYMLSLVRRYPDTASVIGAWYETAKRYYSVERPQIGPENKHYQAPERVYMNDEAYRALKEFIAFHPESRLCSKAQNLAFRALVNKKQWALGALEAENLTRRYPDSQHVDDALYGLTFCRYSAAAYDQALAAGHRVLNYRRKTQSGSIYGSGHTTEVKLLFARIHHLRGELPQALVYYNQVKGSYADARDSIAFLTEEGIRVDEVLTYSPGSAIAIPVDHKNVQEVIVKIYPVDLLLLLMKEKDLSKVTRIDLTGVKATETKTHKLGGMAYQWNKTIVGVPLTKTGAYLVVAKAGTHDVSSLVLVSDLQLTVQRTSGRLRVYATQKATGKPAANTFITVSDGARIVGRGRTDARGVFETGARGSRLSVVGQYQDHLALDRPKR